MNLDPATLSKHMRRKKRTLTPEETVRESGQNPIENIMRNALKAEKLADHATAIRGWAEVESYLAPKRKPIDPADSALKHKQIATLEELTKIKMAILAGTEAAIDEATIIDSQVQDVQAIEHQPSRKPEDFL